MSRKALRSPEGRLPAARRLTPHTRTMPNHLRRPGRRQTTRHPQPHKLTIPSRLRNMEGTTRRHLRIIPVEFLGAVRGHTVVLSRHGE